MYRLYFKKADSTDKILFYDTNNDDLALISPKLSIGVNIAGELSFTLPPNHPYYNELIADRTTTIYVYDDNKLIFKCFPTEQKIDLYKQKKLVCEGVISFLNDSIQTQARYQHLTIAGYLEILINNHNADLNASLGDMRYFKLGNVTVTETENLYRYTNYNSTWKEIKEDLIDNYGGFIVPRYEEDFTYIDYYKDAIRVSNQSVQLGVNLTDYDSNLDTTDYITKIIPLGEKQDKQEVEGLDSYLTITSVNDGKDYLINEEAAATYGIITNTVKWDKVTDPSILKRKGEQYLTDFQFNSVEIEAKAVDLSIIDKSLNKFQLLDSIKVYSKPHGMNKYFVLQKITKTLNDPSKDTLSLSGNVTGMSTKSKKSLVNITNDNAIDTDDVLSQAQLQATAMLNGGNGGYVVIDVNENKQPNRILIMDKPSLEEAQDVIVMNKNGIGFSHDGGETYESAWTIDGHFVADYIASGRIAGNNNPNTYFDLDNAELVSYNPSETDWETILRNGKLHTQIANGLWGVEIYHNFVNFFNWNTGKQVGGITSGDGGDSGGALYFYLSNSSSFEIHDEVENNLRLFSIDTNYGVLNTKKMAFRLDADNESFLVWNKEKNQRLGYFSNTQTALGIGNNGNYGLNITETQTRLLSPNANYGFVTQDDKVYLLWDRYIYHPMLCGTGNKYAATWSGSTLSFWIDNTEVWNSSDYRLKDNIKPLDEAYIQACGEVELKQFTFTPKVYDPKAVHLGVIAQDLRESLEKHGINLEEAAMTSSYDNNGEDYYTVDKQEFLIGRVAYDEKKIQNLEAKVKEQDEKIKELEDKYNELYNLINNLKGDN